MTKLFCDRCDRQVERAMELTIPSPIGNSTKVELCDRCLEYVRNAVKPLPKQMPTEMARTR